MIPLDEIRAARARAAGIVKPTPLEFSTSLSALCGRQLYLKLENLQKTGSFKVRGALNRIQQLDAGSRRRGVITASAGNHAQGVAYAGRIAGVRVTVVMPETAAFSKVEATAAYGAEVVLAGRDYAEAYAHACALASQRGATFVHAYDDRAVIAGQATLGLEILEQLPDVDTIVVPVGGGGLIAGTLSAVRGAGSAARIVGVQTAGASALRPSLDRHQRVELAATDTIADGLATRAVGAQAFAIIDGALADAVVVSDAEVASATLLLLERVKTVAEGAGAVAVAACLTRRLPADARIVVAVVSGGNIDMNVLDRIINLGLVTEGRLFRFSTTLPDRPGELQRLVTTIAQARGNIHQIRHERAQPGLALTQAAVALEVETRGHEHVDQLKKALDAAGFAIAPDAGHHLN